MSGSPQGGVVPPLLSNIYLDQLDKYVEQEVLPMYTQGEKRQRNPVYNTLRVREQYYRKRNNQEKAQELRKQRQCLPERHALDPNYRRLRYVRYADDVRHLTHNEILLAEKGGTEEYGLRVISPTWNRKAKGKGACEKRGKRVKALRRCPARPA